MPIDAARRRRRSSDESDQLPYAKTAAHRAVRATIGQEFDGVLRSCTRFAARNSHSLDAPELRRKLILKDEIQNLAYAALGRRRRALR